MPMTKDEAIALLGGTTTAAGRALGITHSAVSQWADPLPPRVLDRIHAYLYRQQMAKKRKAKKSGS